MYAGSTVAKDPEADVVGVNPASDAPIRAVDESGRRPPIMALER